MMLLFIFIKYYRFLSKKAIDSLMDHSGVDAHSKTATVEDSELKPDPENNQNNKKEEKSNSLKNSKNIRPELIGVQKEVIIGLLLGDGSLEKRKSTHNARLRIDHSYPGQEAYVRHLYNIFKSLCGKEPTVIVRKPDKRNNKIYSNILFKTYNLPCLNEYHSLFYKDSGFLHKSGETRFIKGIPSCISELLTPLALAHWIMGDGYFTSDKTVILCTESFTKEEVQLLIDVLNKKFNIIAGMQKRTRTNLGLSENIGWRIRISNKSVGKLTSMVVPYFITELLYKLGTNKS